MLRRLSRSLSRLSQRGSFTRQSRRSRRRSSSSSDDTNDTCSEVSTVEASYGAFIALSQQGQRMESHPPQLTRLASFFSNSLVSVLETSGVRRWERARLATRLRGRRSTTCRSRLRKAIEEAMAHQRVSQLAAIRDSARALVSSGVNATPFGIMSAVTPRAGFEKWVTLKVGVKGSFWLGAEHEVFSLRLPVLQRAQGYIGTFFSDAANASVAERDEEGRVLVRRSFKHFQAIVDFLRDGSCEMPRGYTPSTYDSRRATTDDEEALELLREAHAYRLGPLVELVVLELMRRWLRSGGEAMRRQLHAHGFDPTQECVGAPRPLYHVQL